MDIKEVIKKYFSNSLNLSWKEYGNGSINLTYKITVKEEAKDVSYILQKMNPTMKFKVMEDIELITKHLNSKNIKTQTVVKTITGKMFVEDGSYWWRMLTYLEGITFSAIESLSQAKKVGTFVGIFHTALLDCVCEFKHKIPYFHDTSGLMDKINSTLEEYKDTGRYLKLKDLAENIISSYKKISKGVELPLRIIHGDLKISNILFDETGREVLALIDLDTFMYSTIAIEMGDALRSWCMPEGEDTEMARFDLDIYNTALNGYISTAKFLTPEERNSISYGVKLITLELAARFLIDALRQSYFTLDSSKYQSLFIQNKKRAENQFEFFRQFSQQF